MVLIVFKKGFKMQVIQAVSSGYSVQQNPICSQIHTQHFAISPSRDCRKPAKRFPAQYRYTPTFGCTRCSRSKACGSSFVKFQELQWKVGDMCKRVQVGNGDHFPTEKIAADGSVRHLNSPCSAVPDSQNDFEDDKGKGENVQFFQVFLKGIVQFVDSNFLPVALLSAMLLGLTWPDPGQALHRRGISKWVTTTFFLIFGLTSGSRDVEKAASAWPAGIFGMISILFLTPLAAIPILWLPITPRELATGLAIFACVPTTLSSGVALTQIAGANMGLALGLTVFSNLLSVVTMDQNHLPFMMPFFLTGIVSQGIGVSIPPGPLLKSLIHTLLLPLTFGKALRELFPAVGRFVDGKRKYLSKSTTLLMSLVPWMQMSNSRCMLLQIGPLDLFLSAVAGTVLHIAYLLTNSALMEIWPRPSNKPDVFEDFNSRAVLIVSSEKSIIVAVVVIDRLGGVFGNAGLLLLPCIAAQLIQVTMDSVLVQSWLLRDAAKKLETYATEDFANR